MPESTSQTVFAPPSIKLTQGGSLLLDIVRFAAALMVFASHFVVLGHGIPMTALGHQSVWVFFVLSGFVIRFITVTRIDILSDYSIDRFSRIFSVVVPALLFTFLCDFIVHAINPLVFGPSHVNIPWGHLTAELFANLTFTSQCWGYELVPFSNGPLWSLSFECFYYAMYALVHYRVRGAWLWVGLLLLLGGPAIALLAPVWLLGCWACDTYLYIRRHSSALPFGVLGCAALLALMGIFRRSLGRIITLTDEAHRQAWITTHAQAIHLPGLFFVDGIIPWFSRASVGGLITGLGTAAVILAGLLLVDRSLPTLPPRLTRYVRIVADSTFALYLFHLPILLFFERLRGRPLTGAREEIIAFICVPLLVLPIARRLDKLKLILRRELQRRFHRRAPAR